MTAREPQQRGRTILPPRFPSWGRQREGKDVVPAGSLSWCNRLVPSVNTHGGGEMPQKIINTAAFLSSDLVCSEKIKLQAACWFSFFSFTSAGSSSFVLSITHTHTHTHIHIHTHTHTHTHTHIYMYTHTHTHT